MKKKTLTSRISGLIMTFLILPFISSCHCDHETEPKPDFKIGHVLCTDGTILSLCDYSTSKKEAIGIVFYLNPDRNADLKGYAVYIHNLPKYAFADSCGVAQNTSKSLMEQDGNSNTYSIYTTTGVASPMANAVFDLWTFGQSAYIPSVAELRLLYGVKSFVNDRIFAVGGEPIQDDDENCWLWSSTEVENQDADKAWLFSMNYGNIHETPKNQPHTIRPIISIRK